MQGDVPPQGEGNEASQVRLSSEEINILIYLVSQTICAFPDAQVLVGIKFQSHCFHAALRVVAPLQPYLSVIQSVLSHAVHCRGPFSWPFAPRKWATEEWQQSIYYFWIFRR